MTSAPAPPLPLVRLSSHVMRPSDVSMVQVYLVDSIKRRGTTQYIIHCLHMGTRAQWSVAHGYSDFLAHRDNLKRCVKFSRHRCPGCVSFTKMLHRFEFPRKKLLKNSDTVVRERMMQFSCFLSSIMSHTFTSTPKCIICGGIAFDMTKEFLLRDGESINENFTMEMIHASLTPRAFFKEYRRDASKIECYKGRTIVKVVQVERILLSDLMHLNERDTMTADEDEDPFLKHDDSMVSMTRASHDSVHARRLEPFVPVHVLAR
jgi:hypothetical protein